MTCKEYIIERLERAERDARNIRDAYERNVKHLNDMEDKLVKIANLFEFDKFEATGKEYVHTKDFYIWSDDFKEEFRIIKEFIKLSQQEDKDLPF